MCLYLKPDTSRLESLGNSKFRLYKYVLHDYDLFSPNAPYKWLVGENVPVGLCELVSILDEPAIGPGAFHFYTCASDAEAAARYSYLKNTCLLEATVDQRDIIAVGPDDRGRTTVAVRKCFISELPTIHIDGGM